MWLAVYCRIVPGRQVFPRDVAMPKKQILGFPRDVEMERSKFVFWVSRLFRKARTDARYSAKSRCCKDNLDYYRVHSSSLIFFSKIQMSYTPDAAVRLFIQGPMERIYME